VLFALGIRYVGETVAKKLARYFGTLEKLRAANFEELIAVNEIGERIAGSILEYFQNPKNISLIETLNTAGLNFQEAPEDAKISEKLSGKKIVISGVFERYSRDELKDLVEKNGGTNSGSISSKTDFILAGKDMGPAKLEKANQLGIKIISEEDFEVMIAP